MSRSATRYQMWMPEGSRTSPSGSPPSDLPVGIENDVSAFPAECLAERLRHSHDEDIAVSVVFGFHLTEAAQDEDVAHLLRHSLDGFLGCLGAPPVTSSMSMYALAPRI